MKPDYVLYADGGARGNPGPAGAGAVVFDSAGEVLLEVSEYLGEQTNNYAEYEAVIRGLKALKAKIGAAALKRANVEVRLDSELVVRQLNDTYQIKEPTLFSKFITVHNMRIADAPNVTFTHVRREKNTHADQLANEAMDSGH